ncbi:phosphopantetheine-binding protein [Nocardia sp. NPDC058518]|uniref:phosphopantetheine-binding protein n=1 Tax=Nocardia sp. NPDC058518 TaxID=3346534 RepID=UPI0036644B63
MTENSPWDPAFEKHLRSALPPRTRDMTFDAEAELKSVGVDSLALVHLLIALEEEFQVAIPDFILVDGSCDTVGGLWKVIDGLRQK